jgi:lipopolysaccharide transport system ATP-binding protein
VLRLQNVGVSYMRRKGLFRRERFWALTDVSFSLYRGESLGIIGRNGAGKSSLLKVMAGIIEPDRGCVVRTDLRIDLLSMRVGFQPHLNGRENAILSGMLMGLRRHQMEAGLREIIAFAELEDFMDQPLRTYSAGMKARLGFAVAFMADPDILLIDEVLGVGDTDFRKKSTELMRRKIQSDKTVVVVSHNALIIRELCDRVVWIERGRTRQIGNAEEVLTSYDNQAPAKRPQRNKAKKRKVV